MKKDIKAELVQLILDKMSTSGQLPWDSGLLNSVHAPVNGKTMQEYRGINFFLLSFLAKGTSCEFLTFHQAQELGGKVKKGAKSYPVVYWSSWNSKEKRPAEKGDNKDDIYYFLKRWCVFEIGDQIEGIEPRRKKVERENKPLQAAEDFIKKFVGATGLKVTHNSSISQSGHTPKYFPKLHAVQIPPREEFASEQSYLASFFHELVHSTGKAMERKLAGMSKDIEAYSKEEVIAEFGAALLCRHFGITAETNNSAAYIQSWSKRLKDNPDWLISGANAAQKAVDYMLEIVAETELDMMLA